MAEKQKLARLSSRFLGPYRWYLYILYIVAFNSIAILSIRVGRGFAVIQTTVYGWMFYRGIQIIGRFQQVYFDQEFLYVYQNQQDYIIPLENIESVEIESLGGVYKVNLYHPEQLGKEFYFKTSLLYPLNAKKKDALVNVLRKKIDLAKSKRQVFQRNALMS
ncbi:MAG: hypothetical protein QY309_08375 [Cyclobacteriaceae bacterium]|nr:MAG: hypothetical protein QY309_08375 [Cyclobacteriaceae bacterium]